MIRTLFTLIVKQYYRVNTGFFLLCFLVCFGIINFQDMVYMHYNIMLNIDKPFVFMLLSAICLLYTYKCFSYTYRALQLPQNSFLYQLQSIGNNRQWRIFTYIYIALYMPLLGYVLIAAGVLIVHYKFVPAALLLLCQLILIAAVVFIQLRRLNGTYTTGRLENILEQISRLMPARKGFTNWLLYYLAYERKGAFLGIKVGSLLLLQALVTYNTVQINRESLAYIMLGLVAVHAVLPYYIMQFAEERLKFVRAMPLRISRRFVWFAYTYAIVLLPELLFLLLHIQGDLHVGTILSIYLLIWGQLCFFASLLYVPSVTIERYMLLVAVLFFASLLLLATFSAQWLGMAYLALSVLLFYLFYERWQPAKE